MSNHFNAFPMMPSHTNPDTVAAEYRGLTKRELFAAMAMQGLAANPSYMTAAALCDVRVGRGLAEIFADLSVKIGDALIAELAKAKE